MEAVNRIDLNRWQLRAAHKVHVVAGIHQMRREPLQAHRLRLPRLEGLAAAQRALDAPADIRRHRGSRPQTQKGTKKYKKNSPQQRSNVYEKSMRDSASLHAVR